MYSFMESRTFFEYMVGSRYTDSNGRKVLHIMKENYAHFSVGIVVPKYVPYLASFNKIIERIVDSGLYQKWEKDVIRIGKENKRINEKIKVCLKNLIDCFLLL